VERTSNYSFISPGRIQLHGAIQPMASSIVDEPSICIDQVIKGSSGYAATLIKSITAELALEKDARRQFQVEADAKVGLCVLILIMLNMAVDSHFGGTYRKARSRNRVPYYIDA
jgi:hypothetical protein